MPIIQVDHLTKEYRLGAMQGLKQTLLNSAARLTGKKVEAPPLFKALDDVSFSIEPGEVVGIIGHNGAGKSTLLKMLAKISTPTRGSVRVDGRIAPLIEVGAGFVPDFTGRENVYLNGAILGMSRQEVDKKFDDIVDFAEMAEFIDTPVKRYSSGMQVKLAFAVATSVDADILIVDEVLSVGDIAFQRKSFDRMEEIIQKQGKTVLVVSHNIRQVQRLSSRVMLLDHGRLFMNGPPEATCNQFFELSDRQINEKRGGTHNAQINSTDEVEFLGIKTVDAAGNPSDTVNYGENVTVQVYFNVRTALTDPVIYVGVHTTDFLYLSTRGKKLASVLEPGNYKISCVIQDFPFLPGRYALRAGLNAGRYMAPVFHGENLTSFAVVDPQLTRADTGEGFVLMECEWAVTAQEKR
jgi:ABC-type polysaccharide/polyol phosphate transport system ATPase subunit